MTEIARTQQPFSYRPPQMQSMDIEVELFATLRQGRFQRKRLMFPPDSTVADVCRHLAIGPHEAAFVMVNGSTATRQHALKAGDAVGLFPPLGGG